MKGTVKWFNKDKGYGFIEADENLPSNSRRGNNDVFVHYTAIQAEGFRNLHDGQRVEFEVITGEKGLQADNVTVIESP